MRGVLSDSECRSLDAAITSGDLAAPLADTGGTLIVGAPHPMGRFEPGEAATLFESYLQAAERWRPILKTLPHAPLDRMVAVFETLADGVGVELARTRGGRSFAPATFRGLAEGKQMQIHRGLDFLQLRSFEELSHVVDCNDQISTFIPISLPEQGGEIELYRATDYLRGDTSDRGEAGELSRELVETIVRERPGQSLSVGKGDLLVFNGGRIFHRVSTVVGARWRWTIGAFLNRSSDRSNWLYWA